MTHTSGANRAICSSMTNSVGSHLSRDFFFLVARNNRARLEQRIYVKDNLRIGMFAEALSIHARASRSASLFPVNSYGCIYSVFILSKNHVFIM